MRRFEKAILPNGFSLLACLSTGLRLPEVMRSLIKARGHLSFVWKLRTIVPCGSFLQALMCFVSSRTCIIGLLLLVAVPRLKVFMNEACWRKAFVELSWTCGCSWVARSMEHVGDTELPRLDWMCNEFCTLQAGDAYFPWLPQVSLPKRDRIQCAIACHGCGVTSGNM